MVNQRQVISLYMQIILMAYLTSGRYNFSPVPNLISTGKVIRMVSFGHCFKDVGTVSNVSHRHGGGRERDTTQREDRFLVIQTRRQHCYNPFCNKKKTRFVIVYYKTGWENIITIRVDSYNMQSNMQCAMERENLSFSIELDKSYTHTLYFTIMKLI